MTKENIRKNIQALFSSDDDTRVRALNELINEPSIRFSNFQLFKDTLLKVFYEELLSKGGSGVNQQEDIINMVQQIPKIWFQMGLQIPSICLDLMKDICKKIYEYQIAKEQRVHKGLILHNIGWIYFFSGNRKKGEGYFLQAFIEDSITHEGDIDTPANKFLTQYYKYSIDELKQLREYIRKSIKDKPENQDYPDICYLDYLLEEKVDRRNKIALSYNPSSGMELLNQVEKSRESDSSNLKGNSFEILVMYLFMTSELFDVRKNLKSSKKEIDILVRNTTSDQTLFNILGDYLFIEAKNMIDPADSTEVKKSIVTMQHCYVSNGIFISYKGFTKPALNILHDEFVMNNRVVIPIELKDIKEIIEEKTNLTEKLVEKYEELRFNS